ncbi:MAG TPA: protein phosphatase 2C domain-containing protein [Gemmatimonadales bacterium]|nr:protein phosphatase 2C domain-containing protein [Gemmatimonadales bacterium]
MTADDRAPAERLPREADIDVFGLTHPGKARPSNADHFLILSMNRSLQVRGTSLPEGLFRPLATQPRGYLFLVADGVGSGRGGEQASESALRDLTRYVTQTTSLYYQCYPNDEDRFLSELRDAVSLTHEHVRGEASRRGMPGMATTLTMVAVFWPRAYLVHVGDSRCYRFHRGRLERMTTDQTMAQALIDAGALTESKSELSPLKHVLTSAIGADEAQPEVHAVDTDWADVLLLCTDGLTKHVSDGEIYDVLKEDRTAEETATGLRDLALERGGSDNITIVVGRLRRPGA